MGCVERRAKADPCGDNNKKSNDKSESDARAATESDGKKQKAAR
jgi:hypothetical protein